MLGDTLNKIFGTAYIKNLKTSVERKNYIINECNIVNLKYEIFEAVDGKLHYDNNFTLQHGPYHLTFPSSAGFMGNQITSFNIITHAITLNLPHIMMLDDDCIFRHTKDIKPEVIELINQNLPEDWDVIILGDIYDGEIGDRDIIYHKCAVHNEAAGSHGIAINSKVFKELQSLFSEPIWLGDGAIGRLIDIGKNVYKLTPSICRQDRTVFSDINQYFH
jgi:GR25 family glycosyltransferase involved in LPS biosynthesis